MQKLIIVSGATGDLGKAYVKHYSKEKNCLVCALSRREEKNPLKEVNYFLCDLEKIPHNLLVFYNLYTKHD
jgi:short-subunit dehydrogenase